MTRTFGYFGGEELWHRAVEVVNSKADQSKEIVGLTVCYFVCEKLSRDLNENSRTESMPIFQKGMAIDTEKLMINHFSPTKERYCYGLFLPSSNKLEPKSKGFEMNKRNCPEVSRLAQAQWVTGVCGNLAPTLKPSFTTILSFLSEVYSKNGGDLGKYALKKNSQTAGR